MSNSVESENRKTSDPDSKDEDIKALRQLVQADASLKCRTDDPYLLRSLRARNFNPLEAITQITNHETMKTKYPELFEDLKVEDLQQVFDMNCFGIAPGRDVDGAAIVYFHCGNWDTSKASLKDIFRGMLMMYECLLNDEETQRNGVVHLYEGSGLSLGHLTQMSPRMVKAISTYIEHAGPWFFKYFLIINESSFLTLIVKLFLMVLSEGFGKRIKPLGKNFEALYEICPKKSLPLEVGGTNEKFSNKSTIEKMRTLAVDQM